MQKGTVIYLTDAANLPADFDEETAIRQAGLQPDWTLMAASSNGFHRLEEAARMLMLRGARVVEARKASLEQDGKLFLFGDALRVMG